MSHNPALNLHDYAEVLRIGVKVLKLTPREVWDLTLDEFYCLMTDKAKDLPVVSQEQAEELYAMFPDDPPKGQV